MSDDTRALPTRPDLGPDEALDGYLERAAALNDITTAQLLHVLLRTGRSGDSPRCTFMMLKTDPELIRAISRWTGVGAIDLRRATLCRFDGGLPLDLHLIDPRIPSSLRQAAPSQWMPGYGTQLCPACITDGGAWRVCWRLPMATTCDIHDCYLTSACDGCLRSFRMQRSSPLRRMPWPALICDNPRGDHTHCQQRLDTQPVVPVARHDERQTASRIQCAFTGQAQDTLGRPTTAIDYLRDLRSLTILLLHLATSPHAAGSVTWAAAAADDARSRGGHPRWALAPPADSRLRAAVLTSADSILQADGLTAAAAILGDWLAAVPPTPEGPRAWAEDHTRLTPTISRIVDSAVAPRRRVAHLLQASAPGATTAQAAGALSVAVYRREFAHLLDLPEATGRAYIALCLARQDHDDHSWGEAAIRLHMTPEQGVRLARNASAHLLTSPEELVDHLRQARSYSSSC